MRYQRLGRDDAPVICADLCSEGPSTSRDAHLCGDVELGLQHIGRTISKSLHSRSASLSIVGWAPGMPLAEMSRALVVQEGRFRCRCSVPSRPSPTSGKQSSSSCPACGGVVRRSRAGGSWGSGHWEAACCAAPDCSQPAQERKMAKARKVGWPAPLGCYLAACVPCAAFGRNATRLGSSSWMQALLFVFLTCFFHCALYSTVGIVCPPIQVVEEDHFFAEPVPFRGPTRCDYLLALRSLALMFLPASAGVAIYAARQRTKLRTMLGIRGTRLGDVAMWCCCPSLALGQEARTIGIREHADRGGTYS